ncbi:glycosyltransferase family 4 protein [Cellulophaga sp. BC115SP]|uniref:glycosyltransferase family 4 protein n=1 Tax=Cellulophaga sp. BC115SP TaxID=2683263 RepID=UPI00141275EC|nr:glycosyltransferase family 4 protein [Cellulophaga sp. BC115SP]NBB31849.1 glycosyltransferase [Cellulophaga sp. BC115SP]
MKILHIFNEIKYSGAEIMYASAAEIFQHEGVELYALAIGNSLGEYAIEFEKNGIAVFHKPIPSSYLNFKLVSYVLDILSFIKIHKIDIIHIHRANAKFIFSVIAKFAGVKSLYTVHNVFKNRFFTWPKAYLERKIAKKVFGLVIQSIGQSVFENELKYYKNPTIRINNWYDNKKFFMPNSIIEKIKMRESLSIPQDNFVIISTGGCSKIKNHSAILYAISAINEKQNITYLHLGCGVELSYEKELAEKLGLNSNVVFLGNKTNVRDYLIVSDVFVMPSLYEGLGIAALESMACGIPSILYNVDGLRDLHFKDDFIIESNIDLLTEMLEWIMKNPTEAQKIAIRGNDFVNSEYSIAKNVASIFKLYSDILNPKM